MIKKKLIIFSILLLLLLVGCSNTQAASANASNTVQDTSTGHSNTVKEEDIPTSETIQKLTEDIINDTYAEASDVNFEDYECIDNVGYLAFSYINNQSLYFGFTVAEQDDEKWKLSYFEVSDNDEEQPVTVFQFIGTYPGTEDRVFHVTAGYVNEEQIKQVTLYYPNSNIKTIQLAEEQKGFLDIDINSDESLEKIECTSSDGALVYWAKREYIENP